MAELLLTVPEAAARLRLAPITIQRQLKRGTLRGIKRGKVWRIPESALTENTPATPESSKAPETPATPQTPATRAAAILAEMQSGDLRRRNAALVALFHADSATREIVSQAAARAVADYDGPDDDFADLRALDGEPFHFPEEEAAL